MGAQMGAYPQKFNLQIEAQQFEQQFWRHMKMSDAGRNMYCAYISDVEEILRFKLLNALKTSCIQTNTATPFKR
jgi:hypothetical protein